MNEQRISADLLKTFPPVDDKKLKTLLDQELKDSSLKLVVLDDDPTGVQTVHDISVYTDWSYPSVLEGFKEKNRLFYILTNSRGMTAAQSEKAHRVIAQNIKKASEETGKDFLVFSRSDSTLRGHYPQEPAVLCEEIENGGTIIDGEVLCPFFQEGGRYTIENVHYVRQGDELVPAAQTEFAQDKTFGYSHSSLPEYVEEKTNGAYPAKDVICISLGELRTMQFDLITQKLMQVHDFQKIVVNAVDYSDLRVFATALYRAIRQGKHFIFRTAAGLVKVMGGISDQPLLSREQMISEETNNGGIVVVGSHTKKTTEQLDALLELDSVEPVALDSTKVLEGQAAFDRETDRCIREAERIIKTGKTAVVFTGRELISLPEDTSESALLRSLEIADHVQRIVADLSVVPAFIVAKGGITSSDIGTKALGVKRADVLGQIYPGIPVWQTGEESKFPGVAFVIFPGNVGEVTTLRDSVHKLMNRDFTS